MTKAILKHVLVTMALALPLAGCMQGAPINSTQAQYLQDLRPCQPGTHPISFPNDQGYRCVFD
jgi:hypothetical protein